MKISKKIKALILIIPIILVSCSGVTDLTTETTSQSTSDNIQTSTLTTETGIWNGEYVNYSAYDISRFGSGTPSGVANYNSETDTSVIWNIDASLDNYGGIQTPVINLDFSKAVYFQIETVSSFTEFILKLAVEGESEYFYVLSDETSNGIISVNIVDAMLSDKYQTKNTQPDPGYQSGWIFDGQTKRCSFHILAKGPDGEQQTAELVVKNISIYNNQPAVESVDIVSTNVINNKVEALKGSQSINLSAVVNPQTEIDQDVIWESSDSSIASIDSSGNVNFIGVGNAEIYGKSAIDQSKYSIVEVNVTSGYEDKDLLVDKLNTLHYEGSSNDISIFKDLFHTSLNQDMIQSFDMNELTALDYRISESKMIVENFFDVNLLSHINEAESNKEDSKAYLDIDLEGEGQATIYKNINGQLYQIDNTDTLKLEYASFNQGWQQTPTYEVQVIILWDNGTVKKMNITVLAATLLEDYSKNNFVDSSLFTIPDRNNLSEDSVINALSPSILEVVDTGISIKQNKYQESKYCFGGIVSNLITVKDLNHVVFILDVESLNQMNDYVKTMWDIRVIYYEDGGITVVNSNPLKIETGYSTGSNIITFSPTYRCFRIYLVVNGSDIGAQFSDATMIISNLKIYQEN
jgi:hypothetical protein